MKSILFTLATAALLASCSTGGNDHEAKNIERTLEFYEQVFNAHNVAMVDSFAHPDFKINFPEGMYPAGIEGLRVALSDQFTAFPDVHVTPNYTIASGDTVVVGYTMTGTNTGSMMGMPPTGKSFSVNGVDVVIIKDNKATEVMGYLEEMKMMTQLGMMPAPGAPADSAGMAPAEPMEQ